MSDDDDDENAVNLAQFDVNLIEIPSDEVPRNGNGNGVPPIALPAATDKGRVASGIQYKSDGMFFAR